MDAPGQQIAQGAVYETVARDAPLPLKTGRGDGKPVVTAAAGVGVSSMGGAVVENFKRERFECGEPFAHLREDVAQGCASGGMAAAGACSSSLPSLMWRER